MGYFSPAPAYRWLVAGLRRWRDEWARGPEITLEAALGLARGRGDDPDQKQLLRLKRDLFLAEHVQTLVTLGAKPAEAAD